MCWRPAAWRTNHSRSREVKWITGPWKRRQPGRESESTCKSSRVESTGSSDTIAAVWDYRVYQLPDSFPGVGISESRQYRVPIGPHASWTFHFCMAFGPVRFIHNHFQISARLFLPSGSWLRFFGAFSRSRGLAKRSHPVVVDHFMFRPNRWLYESGYMKQQRESTGISNFVQIRHHQCALSDRGARLHNTSGKVINFGLPKCVCSVP